MESTIFQLPIAEIVVLQALEIWAGVFCLLLHSAIYLKTVLKKVDFFLKKVCVCVCISEAIFYVLYYILSSIW